MSASDHQPPLDDPAPLRRAARKPAAVIFDMDGVVTDTAGIHARAWKLLFDEVLEEWGRDDVEPFDPEDDYYALVDGRTREDGVRSFLADRGIDLSDEGQDHDPDAASVSSLAQRKQQHFEKALETEDVVVYPGTRAAIERLRADGIPLALVTASRNGERVLGAAAIADWFDTRVDGVVVADQGMAGKPDPAMFLEAARRLGVAPARAVVIEDAEAGVQAGASGGFGLVVGVARHGDEARLEAAGAHLVVGDVSELDLAEDYARFSGQRAADFAWEGDPWTLCYRGFDPATESHREVLCAVGNGLWGSRGAAPESREDGTHYPGTYLAGIYNRSATELDEYAAQDEHMVNVPNWLPLTFATPGEEPFTPAHADLLDYVQQVDLMRGVLLRTFRYRDSAGRITRVASRRLMSLSRPHIASLETVFEAENWSGSLWVDAELDGTVANRNVDVDQQLAHDHLRPLSTRQLSDDTVLLEVETRQSAIHIAMASRVRVTGATDQEQTVTARDYHEHDSGIVGQRVALTLAQGAPVTVEKTVAVSTSRDRAVSSPTTAVSSWISRQGDFESLLSEHVDAWTHLWEEFGVDVEAEGHQPLALNLNTFQVLQTVACADADLDAGVPARGLHGEGYRGHVFWDELFVYPVLTLRRPAMTRALLTYRHRRLDEAIAAARAEGHQGAMYPWQSGSDGSEETPPKLFNRRNGEWMPDHSHRQRHVGLAIAYSAWEHYQATGDVVFLREQGAEMMTQIARFFAGLATYDEDDDRYDIDGVMGPDEFHDGYPDSPGEGVRNNAYTNILTAWTLRRACDVAAILQDHHGARRWDAVRPQPEELESWRHISERLRVPWHDDGIISQFEGYEQLAELDWDAYRKRYGSIGRLDLILQAEGDNTNNYKASKQPDVLMLLYLFSAEELRDLLSDMGYDLRPDAIVTMVDYYSDRTAHGSTLSHVVHSWVEARRDRYRSWVFFTEALDSDLADIQGGTTKDGIHVGAMAGSADMAIRCYLGLELRDDRLWLHPQLPREMNRVSFRMNYRGQWLRIAATSQELSIDVEDSTLDDISVNVDGEEPTLSPGQSHRFALSSE